MKKEIIKKNSCKRYKAIIFDLDGTLIDSMPYHELAFKDLLLEYGVRIDEKHLRKLLGLSTGRILSALKKKHKFKENIENLREERRYHYFKFLGTKNIIFPGVMKKLQKLRLDYKIAIATSSSFVTYNHSADEDFKKMFDAVVTINDVKKERGKPFPDQLLLAAKKMRVDASECLMIGDSIYDGLAAKRASMDFIGVLTGYTSKKELAKEEPIRVLASVKDLKL
jgi:HAD superfamily hydrolase (TIGR01509 family)